MRQKWNIKIESLDKLAEDLQRIDDLITDLKDEVELLQIGNLHAEPVQEDDGKTLAGKQVFLVDKKFESCEAAHIVEVICTTKGTLLRLESTLGKRELRYIEELGKTVFFTQKEALAALKVDEDGNPINTYLTEFIKRFPENADKEKKIIERLCCNDIFELKNCPDPDFDPENCKRCWNQPYREAKGGKTDEQRND